MTGAPEAAYCCDEFRSAVAVTFAVPVNGPTGWLLYGTDAETASAGLPELRYWAARFCPFCGAALLPYPGALPRGRAFGFGPDIAGDDDAGARTGQVSTGTQGYWGREMTPRRARQPVR